MSMYIYDFEVLRYDWLVVIMLRANIPVFKVFHNNPAELMAFMRDHRDDLFCGFNSKNYDQWIMKTIAAGGDNEDVKAMNDYIIAGGNGWDHPVFKQFEPFWFNNVDIMDDTQKGLSLKAIEGHLGMSIVESSVPFDLDRPLTEAELGELVMYCKHDVEATGKLVELRKDYLNTKISIGKMVGLSEAKSLSCTNAKLTTLFLNAKKPSKPWTDERKYVYPDNLLREYIPQEVFDFFNRTYDPSVSDEDMYNQKLKLNLGEAEATLGFGGVHLGIPNYQFDQEAMPVCDC